MGLLGNVGNFFAPPQQPNQFNSLLGTDRRAARWNAIGSLLQGAGVGLATGDWGAALGASQDAQQRAQQQALLGYGMQQQADERNYNHEQDAANNALRQQQWDYRVGRDKVSDAQWAAEQQRLAAVAAQGGGDGHFGTLVPLKNPTTGEFSGWGQLRKDGGIDPLNAGDGYGFMSPYETNASKAAGGIVGKGQGEAAVSASSLESKLPGLDEVVSQLDGLSEKATYSLIGQGRDFLAKESGLGPTEGAQARTTYEAVVNNQILPLLRDTFGAQFTAQEGESLKKTLGDPNKTPPEKQAVLRAFIEQKRRDLAAFKAQAAPTTLGTGKGSRLRYNADTGELE